VLLNAHHEELPFQLPQPRPGRGFRVVFDTARLGATPGPFGAGATFPLAGRSLAVLEEAGGG
jgi:glycogen operon protein